MSDTGTLAGSTRYPEESRCANETLHQHFRPMNQTHLRQAHQPEEHPRLAATQCVLSCGSFNERPLTISLSKELLHWCSFDSRTLDPITQTLGTLLQRLYTVEQFINSRFKIQQIELANGALKSELINTSR